MPQNGGCLTLTKSVIQFRKGKEYTMISRFKKIVLIRQAELGREITQEEISQQTGISRVTIGKWMSNRPMTRFDSETVLALMRWANCSLEDLLEIVEVETAL
jgi:DNA-binding Xre family transcriptional regulator